MKKLCLIFVACGTAFAALTVAGPASAAVTCSFSSNQVTINATGNGTNVEIIRNGAAIQVNGAACGAADVNNTAKIVLNGGAGRQLVYIDFSGGAFAPGFGADTGVAEIEFAVDLKLGYDYLELDGSSNPNNYRIGTDGINFNGDGDVDITMPNVEQLTAYGFGGADTLRADGGLGTGGIYTNPVYLYGGDGGDTLTGGSNDYGSDSLDGGNQNDVINGGDGSDYLYGGAGADQLNGGLDPDYFYPGLDNDTVNGGEAPDQIYCTDTPPDGNDVFNGGGGADYVSYYQRTAPLHLTIDGLANDGQSGETDNIKLDVERVQGGTGADTITGSDASNNLDGWGGADIVHGGPGDDNVYGGSSDAGADELYGDDGLDSLYGYDGADKLYGGTSRDALTGGLGNDLLDGGSGNETFYAEYNGLDGSDNIIGGPGRDYAYYYRPTGDQTFTLGDNTANDGLAGEKDNIHSDVEDVAGGEGKDTLIGNAAFNSIYGYGGNDTIDGKDGNDYLEGYEGNDTITGGDGEDYLYGDNGGDSFKVQDGGYDVVYGGTDGSTDVVVNKDPIDSISEVP